MLRALTRTRPGTGDKAELFVRGGPRGVLCLHGFTGTPFEVRPLAEALAGRGYTVLAPQLAGHCGTMAELVRTGWPDWLASASAALDRLIAASGGPVAIAGFSTLASSSSGWFTSPMSTSPRPTAGAMAALSL